MNTTQSRLLLTILFGQWFSGVIAILIIKAIF